MQYTVLCTFNQNVGWRIHSVTTLITDTFSVVTRNGIKMLAIPVSRKTRAGHFCNPVKFAMLAVRELNRPLRLAQPCAELLQEEQTFVANSMLQKIQQTCVSIEL